MAEPQLFPNQPVPEQITRQKGKETADTGLTPTESNVLNSVATRLKILEERYTTMRKKTQITEQNIIENEKAQFQQFHLVSDEVMDLKHKVKELAEKISMLSDELEHFARLDDVKVIEKYLNYWNPMDYVTRKEVNSFLRKKFKEEKS